ncbi:YkoP family protein [Lederbergia citrisecunda]|uniref:YkoP family protein n=1 Tax=Lederbergia citrisecunda TaxID=2833583 RepID=UPI003D814188
MLYKGCKKSGFEAHPIASPIHKKFKKVSLLPIYFLSSSRGIRNEIPSPMYLFMSKDALISRYRGE